jgi:hypothetical protein
VGPGNHHGADPEHVQDHLRILRIVFIAPVVQGLSGALQCDAGDEADIETSNNQTMPKTRW